MFSKYSWGQFGFFVFCLLVIYYVGVAALFYRAELLALIQGKKLAPGRPTPAKPTAAPGLGGMGASKSEVAGVTAAPVEASEADNSPEAGAADNLPEVVPVAVTGTLPDSSRAHGNEEDAVEDAETGFEEEEAQFDTVDPKMAALLENAAAMTGGADFFTEPEPPTPAAGPVSREEIAAAIRPESLFESSRPTVTRISQEELDRIISENANGRIIDSENVPTFASVNSENTATVQEVNQISHLTEFEPVASPLDTVVLGSSVVDLDEMADYMANLVSDKNPPLPAGLQGTSLVERIAVHQQESMAELQDLFAMQVS